MQQTKKVCDLITLEMIEICIIIWSGANDEEFYGKF